MYERFTDRARNVMKFAADEALRYKHEYIGTEHILLGLVAQGSGGAALVLENFHIGLRMIRREVDKILQTGPGSVAETKLPQTPRAKKVIEYSIEEARKLNRRHIGTEHILLGLLRDQETVAYQILLNLGLTIEDVRKEVVTLLGRKATSEVAASRDSNGSNSCEQCPACGAQLTRVLSTTCTSWLSPEERAAAEAGSIVLCPGDRKKELPRVCLACTPAWRDVHRLALQLHEWQFAKEEAIAAQDFNRATSIRDQQQTLQPQLATLLDRLLGPERQL